MTQEKYRRKVDATIKQIEDESGLTAAKEVWKRRQGATAPQQRNLITRRWRRVKVAPPREDRVQMEVVSYFNHMRVSGAICIHIPNQEMRKERFGKLKAMGAYPGAADLMFLRVAEWSSDLLPSILFLEMKRCGDEPNDTQVAFGNAVKACGAYYGYADSLQMAIDILEKYGYVRKDVSDRGRQEIGVGR